MAKYSFELKDAVDEDEERIELRVLGPIQQNQAAPQGHWGGNWTPDEAEELGVSLIQVAAIKRRGGSVA